MTVAVFVILPFKANNARSGFQSCFRISFALTFCFRSVRACKQGIKKILWYQSIVLHECGKAFVPTVLLHCPSPQPPAPWGPGHHYLEHCVCWSCRVTSITWVCTFCHMKMEGAHKLSAKMTFIKFPHYYFDFPGFIEASFASLLEEGRVSHTDSEQSPVDAGQMFEAGTSSYASSPSTSGFDPQNVNDTDNQPNGAVKKKPYKESGSRRIKKRKHKKK